MHCLMELIGARRLYDYITRVAVRQPPGKTGSRRFISVSGFFPLANGSNTFRARKNPRLFIYLVISNYYIYLVTQKSVSLISDTSSEENGNERREVQES